MQIKTFEANSMAEALKAAKEAFGPEAVILGVKTQNASARWLGRWKKRKVALTAATDTPHPDHDTVSIAHSHRAPVGQLPARPDTGGRPQVVRTFASPLASAPSRQMLPSGYINKLFWIQQQMRIGGVDRDIARELMAGLHQEAAQQARITETSLLESLKAGLQDRIRRKPASTPGGDRPKTVVFIGPTGVGKTTTIAKIAALYNHNRPGSVGLVTLDDQRIGGMSQLATYARIIGIPARAAASPAALRTALEKLADRRLVLVDTGGVNPYDPEQVHRLDTALSAIDQPRVHLVLSTLTRSSDLNTMVDAFKRLPVQDLLFTKVDESTSQGNILSQSLRSGLPLSYYTDGRDIPDDIHVLTAESLVRMIFNPTSLRRAKTAAPEILAERLQDFEDELENIPMAYSPYRTYSAGPGSISGAYAAMAASNG